MASKASSATSCVVSDFRFQAESVVISKGGRLVARVEAAGGRHVALDLKSKNPLMYFTRVWKLCKILHVEQPDLVCVHSSVPAWLFVGVRRLDSFIDKIKVMWQSLGWHTSNTVPSASRRQALTRAEQTVDRYHASQRDADGTVTGATPEGLYGDILQYVSRHSFAGRMLKGPVTISEAECTFGDRLLAVCHGDFHAKNFGFVGDEFAAVYDFDKLTEGLACGDLVNALMERFSCFHLSRAARKRLKDVTRRIVAAVPWPREELVIAANAIRFQFAARRIRKHPNSSWVAIDVWRRDRALREFLKCLG